MEAGLLDSLTADNALWLDYDRDGHIDLYLGQTFQESDEGAPDLRNKLYRNLGDETFADVTREAGLDVQLHPIAGGSSNGMVAADFSDDGWPDLYLGVHLGRNRLFFNNGQGGFQDATTGEIGDQGGAFGVTVGDIDNDGDLDIFQAAGGYDSMSPGQFRSLMLMNVGGGQFLDMTDPLGLDPVTDARIQGAGLADIDNDGDLDLLMAHPLMLFLNDGNGDFADSTPRSGILPMADLTVAFADYDVDGFVDAILGNALAADEFRSLYRNSGNGNHYLRVEVVGVQSNRSGIGARVIAASGNLRQTREIVAGSGRSQDEMVAHFGLGARTRVDEVEVRWPSGQVDVLRGIPVDQKIRVVEGREVFHTVHPTLWEGVDDSLVAGFVGEFSASVRPALFEEGAQITRVVADMRNLGGLEEAPLLDTGDGIYRLQIPVAVTGAAGLRMISVLIEQTTSLGSHWTSLSKALRILPARDQVVFADAMAGDWKVEGDLRVQLDPRSDAVVYEGDRSLALQVSGFNMQLTPAVPVSPVGYRSLRFAFHPGDVEAARGSTFNVSVDDRARGNDGFALGKLQVAQLIGGDREGVGVDLERKDWQVVEIPLEGLSLSLNQRIVSIGFMGDLRGVFYLDDIRLVTVAPPPGTAVVDDHSAGAPKSFSLSQNYPNPFNPETTIRFDLPQAEEIELALYDLTGQKVATLAEGLRETGTYSLRWDGRDEDGRELASGVYLYRLIAGDRVATRKLLLLR